MDYIFELNCFIEDKGNLNPFSLQISKPFRPDKNEEECHCLIYAPYLFKQPKKIAGIDEGQAVELSKKFISILIEGKRLCDEKGNLITI